MDIKFDLIIPHSKDELKLVLNLGEKIFILGANGTGKSSLMHKFYTSHHSKAYRISAHRQTWLYSNSVGLTSKDKIDAERAINNSDQKQTSRWMDQEGSVKVSLALYDLIDCQTVRNRKIAQAVDNKDYKLAEQISTEKEDPVNTINEIFKLSNINIKISIEENNQIFASKNGSPPYSIAELSDGERNSLLIAASILTMKSESLVLIDEPERHLHRSIISPLLQHLFSSRSDCAFVISTHDVMLPIKDFNSRILLVRGCSYSDNSVKNWEVDLLEPNTNIDEEIKKDILGGRKKLLFVEGTEKSIDKPLYSLIFPNFSVIPKSSCRDVENAVVYIRDSQEFHWLNAFGIVDNDRRGEDDINKLKERGVYAIPVFSVEAIYYHPEILEIVAKEMSDNHLNKLSTAKDKAIKIIAQEKTLEHLIEKITEKRVREKFFKHLPHKQNIKKREPIEVSIDINKFFEEEQKKLNDLVSQGNFYEIILRYPVRETSALDSIAKELGFNSSKIYEARVIKLLSNNDKKMLNVIKSLFGDLISDIDLVLDD